MTAVVLDTHALIWLFDDPSRLNTKAETLIRDGCADSQAFISAITPWEIAMLVAKGRLTLSRDIDQWIAEALDGYGIDLAPLSPDVAIASTRLPGVFHSDPADRIIVATARALDATLLTEDRLILDYCQSGHVKALRASH